MHCPGEWMVTCCFHMIKVQVHVTRVMVFTVQSNETASSNWKLMYVAGVKIWKWKTLVQQINQINFNSQDVICLACCSRTFTFPTLQWDVCTFSFQTGLWQCIQCILPIPVWTSSHHYGVQQNEHSGEPTGVSHLPGRLQRPSHPTMSSYTLQKMLR